MWSQWSQYAGAPPLPTTAPPPPPQEPSGVADPSASAIIGPMLPTAPVAPSTAMPAASIPTSTAPSAAGANPYSQYTAAQYAAMTPEQQYALQQHWQQWQKYQEEYARWHAQYGEQYKREMQMAQVNTAAATPAIPVASATPAAYPPTYYPQPPPNAPTNKITGQPQLYTQPPPHGPGAQAGAAIPTNYSPVVTSSIGPQQQQTPPSWQQQPPPSFNQPPPNFNQQNVNANNSHMNSHHFQQPPWSGASQQGPPIGKPNMPNTNSENSQFNNRNNSGNHGTNTSGGQNNWQGPPNNNWNNNQSGNRGNGPNNRPNNNWNSDQNAGDPPNEPTNNFINQGKANRNFDPNNRGNTDSNVFIIADDMPTTSEKQPNEDRNKTSGNVVLNNSGPINPEISGLNNWNERGNNLEGPGDNDRNRGLNNLDEGRHDRNFGPNNRGPNNNRWNDGQNDGGNNNPNDWNDDNDNHENNYRNFGSSNQGQNSWNDGPSNNRGPNIWNDGPNNNRGPNNWNDGPNNNRDPNNWNDGYNNRGNNLPNNRNSRGPNDRNFGSNNRGPTNRNDVAINRGGGNNAPNDRDDSPNNRGDWRDGPINRGPNERNRGNNRSNDRSDRSNSRDNRGPDNRGNTEIPYNGPDNRGYNRPYNSGRNEVPNQRRGPGPNNRVSINDLDEEMFDRQFRNWEQQFEDWKRANANHPDKEMYRRYEQEFENQRKRIAERREQMRRRKLEQMGLDPNKPPPQPSPNRDRTDSVGNDSSGRKRNDSIGSQQSSTSKHNQEHNQNKLFDKTNQTAQETTSQPDTSKENPKVGETTKCSGISQGKKPQDEVMVVEDETNKSTINKETQQQNRNTATPLGKRKSRFDTPAPANKIKPIETAEVINLDDEDDAENIDENPGKMSEIFKKVDGIPGLDLTDDNSSDLPATAAKNADTSKKQPDEKKIGKNKAVSEAATPKKIPSLFDIKVDKPDMTDLVSEPAATTATANTSANALPELAKTLNDPDFLKRISEAVAHAKGGDSTKLPDDDWQKRNQGDGAEDKPIEDNTDFDNTNSRESFRDKASSVHSETGDDMNSNFSGNNGGGMRGMPNNIGGNNNFGPNCPNNFGPNGPNNFGSNGPNNFGPNGPNNFAPNGPNNFGPNGPNNFGPNGPNNWGPNGPNNNFGTNNNFGPNGRNNWGPNGPNNWGPNGPNNWGPNGPNNDFGGPNNRGGNNFGPNGPGRNFGGNGPNFGRNDGPGRNFGGNGPNFGPNDGPGRNFGRNGNNFGPNDGPGRNFGRNGPNFGPNEGHGRNFGCNGPNFGPNEGPGRNFGRNGPNFGPNDGPGRNFGPNDGPVDNFGRDGNRRNMSRDSSNDRRDNTKNIASMDDSNTDDSGTSNRNINNPFRRNVAAKVESVDGFQTNDKNDSWKKGPDDHVNLDYDDYYRPVQVIDYTNSNATPTTTIMPKVIDYGHKPVLNDDSNDFKPLKIINYDHASKARNPPQKQWQQQKRLSSTQKRNMRKNINNTQQQDQKQNQNPKQIENQQQQQQTPTAENPENTSNDQKDLQEHNKIAAVDDSEQCELEEISDCEDIPDEPASPPPPPPPMFNSSGTFTPFAAEAFTSSIFPSTAEANENLPKVSSAHVQMSIPTEENNNTISIDEILMKPGRQTRPKKMCMILRGPPGSGKSHVAKLIKEKEKEMGGNNPRILSIDDYFIIENDYEEKCPKTGKKIPKKEILYEYDKDMEEKYMEYLIKSFKKTIADNFYDFIVIDCNNNSLRSLNEFYCHSKDSGYVPYIIDLFCDLETCLNYNIHARSEKDIKQIIDTWKATPCHYIKLDISSLLQNIVEMEDAEDMAVDDNTVSENAADSNMMADANEEHRIDEEADNIDAEKANNIDEDDSNDSIENCGFLKSKWETDTTTQNLARLDGTSKLSSKRKPTMEEYLQMDEWQPSTNTKGKKRVRWADIEEKREQEKMRAVGFVVGQTDWKRMMDPNAAKRALNKTKYIERVNKKR